ncbi:MAG: J domain-containing protein [Acetobacteraceae bacterium]|nr:J domain-containing protein [Acetobacteraceae bacterium]MBV8589790.1 J domain-containing protein [Acetobacteraceae bacterium]
MAEDPYKILGVQKTDSAETIRAAYRKLAKQYHPDLNPGKAEAAERFKTINAAYDLLSDPDKRARYDRGEIDASGQERPHDRHFYREYGDAPGRGKYRTSQQIDPEDLEAFFAQAFGGGGGGFSGAFGGGEEFGGGFRREGFSARGRDAHYTLTVSFLDAANGTKRRIELPDGRTLDVTIPAGIEDGHTLRLKGQGNPGIGGGPAGDALVEITVAPHPYFRRDGDDIVITLPVTLREAVLGAAITVPTIKGAVRVTVPPNSGTGTRLRLRARGIKHGHQYVELNVIVPPGEEPELAEFLRHWKPRHEFNPREGMEGG